jgi:hypothetical protein
MTVHHLALELYHWMQRLEELEQEQARLGPEAALAEHTRLETELAAARKAVAHYRQLLEAQKEQPKI